MRNEAGLDGGVETGSGTGGVVGNAEQHYRCWGKLYGTPSPSHVTDVEVEAKGQGTGQRRDIGRDGDRGDEDGEEGRDSASEVVLSGLESTGGSSYM